jgi:tetratricopeptide (TPR) repeat protein
MEAHMELKLKAISKDAIPEALSKVMLYRYLNEPEEAESICHDILAVDPQNQAALRALGLTITDQFTGASSDRYAEAGAAFQQLTDAYERLYYTGLFYERRAKAQMRDGCPAKVLVELFKEAMALFEQAEKVAPQGNDDAVLRWNRCVRLLEKLPHAEQEPEETIFEEHDTPPVTIARSSARGR